MNKTVERLLTMCEQDAYREYRKLKRSEKHDVMYYVNEEHKTYATHQLGKILRGEQ